MAGMQPRDVFRLRSAADPRVSPDGTTVAYVVSWVDEENREPRSAIWAATVDGSTEPRRLTFGPKGDATPRWSPDGRWLAFTSARDSEVAQLYVSPVDAPGEARRLTDLREEVTAAVWAPDGSRIAFVSARHDDWDLSTTSDVYVVSSSGGEPRRLSQTEGTYALPS